MRSIREELSGLVEGCARKLQSLREQGESGFAAELLALYTQEIGKYAQQIAVEQENGSYLPFREFVRLKTGLRTLLKQLAALSASGDWQSPGFNPHVAVQECGAAQRQILSYMRTHASEDQERLEAVIAKEYYRLDGDAGSPYMAHMTSSGMKALEIALISYKATAAERLPVYYHEGVYFEGKSLIKRLIGEAQEINAESLLGKLERNEEIGCIILDSGINFPITRGVNLRLLFDKLGRYRQSDPLFVIVDKTLSSVACNLLDYSVAEMPGNIVVVSVESLLKYYQCGLDLANLGFIVYHGKLMGFKRYREIVTDLFRILSAYPDDSVIRRLPEFSIDRLRDRLLRMSDNARHLHALLSNLREAGIIDGVSASIAADSGYRIHDEPWHGTLVYIQIAGMPTLNRYERLVDTIMTGTNADMAILSGLSFGFDTTRVCIVQEFAGPHGSCCLRVSVGREEASAFRIKAQHLRSALVAHSEYSKEVHDAS